MGSTFRFSGYGIALPPHRVTNRDLEGLGGLDRDRIRVKPAFASWSARTGGASEVDYFVSEVMGFETRFHVAAYPAREGARPDDNAVELAERAFRDALGDASLSPDAIDAWVLSTVSFLQVAPDVASIVKSRITGPGNRTPVYPLQMGCPGFNMGLQVAHDLLRLRPEVRHVAVAHTEVMTGFLTGETDLMPWATFGDGAAGVVLSRSEAGAGGLLAVVNHQDPEFIPILGVSPAGRLYIDAPKVKERAILNMEQACRKVLREAGWSAESVDLFVPHQTGNAICVALADALGLRPVLCLEAQRQYGNTAGATVPMALRDLARQHRLPPGTRVLSASAGVGGGYGAFAYQVP